MISDKRGIQNLVDICVEKGLRTVVISPGSRNAPLIITFNRHHGIECLTVVDERSAGFFALGIAQQTKQPVALVSTSGSAVLNYAPAIVEAYYQKVPLLILTADRPGELIDQGEHQTIRQNKIFRNYVKKSFQLPIEPENENDLWYNNRIISEAFNSTVYPDFGPVHINIPLREPLYDQKEYKADNKTRIINNVIPQLSLSQKNIEQLSEKWNSYEKKLILIGCMDKNPELNNLLNKISLDNSVVILAETTSNLKGEKLYSCIDRILPGMQTDRYQQFQPELLITMGGAIISKRIKAFLRNNKPVEHWHISPTDLHLDTYKSLTANICVEPEYLFIELINRTGQNNNSDYNQLYCNTDTKTEVNHSEFLSHTPYSDLKVFECILKAIPPENNLQMGNSTPVRYVQLFKPYKELKYNANRGVSGIDGCMSTAIGAAWVNNMPTTLIVGDLSFFYDSNALWNNYIHPDLRIIVINNSGGGIFRILDGPSETQELESCFEVSQNLTTEYIAKTYDISYYLCESLDDLNNILPGFYDFSKQRPAILEIKTPQKLNAKILKDYFNFLNK